MQLIRLMQQYQCGWTRFPHLIEVEPPLYAIVDGCDYDYLMQWRWFFLREGNYWDKRVHFKSVRAVILGEHSREIVTMQRLVMQRRGVALTGRVYHRNRDKLDNRFENLTLKRSEIEREEKQSAAENG